MGSITETLSIEKTQDHFGEFSFSSYLNPSEEVFIRRLVETSKIPNSTVTIHKDNIYTGKRKIEGGEIGIFGAEKYFNGRIDEETITRQQLKNQEQNVSPCKVKTQARTPSVHSEASWNSQNGLLQIGRKNSIHDKNAKRRHGTKSLLSALCSCGDKNSVDIGEHKSGSFSKQDFIEEIYLDRTNKSLMNPQVMEEMQMKRIKDFEIGLRKEDCFTFPIVNSKPGNFEIKLISEEKGEEKKRKSFEVLGSPILENRNESISLENKLELFNINKPKKEETDFPPVSGDILDDFASDTSSDLFEIQSFSTTNNSNPYLLTQASNSSINCATPRTCYAPSEASIEWSVVTASAADFPFNSDPDYQKSSFKEKEIAKKTTPKGKGKEVERRRLGILSGCKSQKAVKVIGNAYTTNIKVHTKIQEGNRNPTSQVFRNTSEKGRNGST